MCLMYHKLVSQHKMIYHYLHPFIFISGNFFNLFSYLIITFIHSRLWIVTMLSVVWLISSATIISRKATCIRISWNFKFIFIQILRLFSNLNFIHVLSFVTRKLIRHFTNIEKKKKI